MADLNISSGGPVNLPPQVEKQAGGNSAQLPVRTDDQKVQDAVKDLGQHAKFNHTSAIQHLNEAKEVLSGRIDARQKKQQARMDKTKNVVGKLFHPKTTLKRWRSGQQLNRDQRLKDDLENRLQTLEQEMKPRSALGKSVSVEKFKSQLWKDDKGKPYTTEKFEEQVRKDFVGRGHYSISANGSKSSEVPKWASLNEERGNVVFGGKQLKAAASGDPAEAAKEVHAHVKDQLVSVLSEDAKVRLGVNSDDDAAALAWRILSLASQNAINTVNTVMMEETGTHTARWGSDYCPHIDISADGVKVQLKAFGNITSLQPDPVTQKQEQPNPGNKAELDLTVTVGTLGKEDEWDIQMNLTGPGANKLPS